MNAADVLLPVALVAISFPALATSTTRLDYQAPQDCPSESEFAAAVAARGVDFEAPGATEGHHLMVISIRKQGNGFVGSFQVRDERDVTKGREVRAPSCGDVADALAVMTAIELHTEAGNGSSESTTSAQAPAARSDSPTSQDDRPSTGPPPSPPDDRLRGSTRAFPPRTESLQVRAGTLRFDLQRSATVYAGASFGAIPSVALPRYDLSLVGANFITTPEGAHRISGLVLKLRLSVLGSATYQSQDTKTDASGLSFGIDLCQSPLYDTRGLVLLFCSGYGGGVMMLKTRGLDGGPIQFKNTGFGEASLSAEAQYHLGAGFHIGVKVGGGLTIGQIAAERADGSRIFESSPWSAYALFGLGFRF
jgi:hypothetical protein